MNDADIYFLLREKFNELKTFRSAELRRDPISAIKFFKTLFDRFRDDLLSEEDLQQLQLESLSKIVDSDDQKLIDQINRLSDAVDVFPLYRQWKLESNVIDFGDMITNLWTLLNNDKEVLQILQSRFEHIIVDEFQDNNFALSQIICKIAEPQNSITVVGDDDQCIYSFRGANIQNVHNFAEIYKNHPQYRRTELMQNYRSIPEILNFANSVIELNPERMEKGELFSDYSSAQKPKLGIGTPEDQGLFIVDEIKELLGNGVSLGEIAVLCRTHSKCNLIASKLMLNQISVDYYFTKLFGQNSIKDIVGYFNIIADTEISSLSLVRILQRKFSPDITGEFTRNYLYSKSHDSLLEWCSKNDKIDTEVSSFCNTLIELKIKSKDLSLFAIFDAILKISELLKSNGYIDFEYQKIIQSVSQFQQIVQNFSQGYSPNDLQKFVRFIDVLLDVNEEILETEKFRNTDNAVQVMTVHNAKGKEFPYVFIPYLSSGGFPLYPKSAKASDYLPSSWRKWDVGERTDKELHYEEERRIFYVAITRAEKQLVLTAPEKRQSQYVKEIQKDSIEEEIITVEKNDINLFEQLIAEFQNRLLVETSLGNYESSKSIIDAIEQIRKIENGTEPNWDENPYQMEVEEQLNQNPQSSKKIKSLRLSATKINKYETCPLQYKFSQIDGIPGKPAKPYFKLGNVVHRVLEIFHNEGFTKKRDLVRLLNENWDSGGFVFGQEEEQNRQDALKMLDNYYEFLQKNEVNLFSSEKLFTFKLANCDVSGKCDRIDVNELGEIKIIDYKTSKRQKTEKELKKDIQMAIYAMYAQLEKNESNESKKLGKVPKELSQLFLRHENPEVTINFTNEELAQFREKIEAIAHKIRKGDFHPQKGNHCQFCDYRDLVCPLFDE